MRLAACQIAACEFFDLNSTDTCGLFRALRKITPACFLVYLAWRRPDREKNPEDLRGPAFVCRDDDNDDEKLNDSQLQYCVFL